MKRLLALLLLVILSGEAAAADDFLNFRDSFRSAFGLMGGSEDPSPETRLAAVEAVGTFAHEESTRLLILGIRLEQERIDALLAERELTRTGRNRELKGHLPGAYLRDLKKKLDGEYQVVEAIEGAFEKLTDEDAISYLADIVLRRAKHWKQREVAARAVGRIGVRKYVKALAKALRDKDVRVRAAVLLSLGAMRAEEALFDIVKALKDKDWVIRSAAVEALRKIRDPRAFEALLALMKKEAAGLIAQDCAEALDKITGQAFGRAAGAWASWWEKNRERALAGERLDDPPKPKEKPGVDEDGYYHGIPVLSRRTIFIIDISQSMTYSAQEFQEKPKPGELSRLALAKRELLRAVANYDPNGTFGLIAFHSLVKLWRPKMVPATPVMKDDAREWVTELKPTGTTNIYGALELAFRTAGMGLTDKYYEPAVDTIFLLSDGAPTNQDLTNDDPERVLRAVRGWNRIGRMRINTIGLKGHSASFMSRLARENGGTYSARD